MDELYTLENARKFNWSSVSGRLNHERVFYLENYIIGTKILDAGCGGGAYVEFLANKKTLRVTGIDKYDQFLGIASNKKNMGTYIQGNITKLPFPDKAFDCTYCFDVLEHVDDEAAIREMSRVTVKRLILAVPKEDEIMNSFGLTFFHYQDKTHIRNYTEVSLKKLISTIKYNKIVVLPELPVSFTNIAKQMIEFNKSSWAMKFSYRKLFHYLLNKASHEKVYTGLVAIVDL